MKIAFIGLGHMGAPMARNLLKAGHTLSVFDLVPGNVEALASLGASAAASARAAASQGELVITMLPSSPHVKGVYLGDEGVLAGPLQARASSIRAPSIRIPRGKSPRPPPSAGIPWPMRRSRAAPGAPRPGH